MSPFSDNDIQGSAHFGNYKSKVLQVCYELFQGNPEDENTWVDFYNAKTNCEAMGYQLPEFLTPGNVQDFKALADRVGTGMNQHRVGVFM